MTLAVFLALALQADPEIRAIERLTGDVHRPYLWAPLLVEVASAAGFEGDLEVGSSFKFTVRRAIRLAPGGQERFLVPAIDPDRVTAGTTERRVPRAGRRVRLLVGVDERLKFAGELAATDDTAFRILRARDLDALLGGALGEAFDLVLLAGGTDAGARGRVVASREEADRAVATLAEGAARERIPVMDRSVWRLQPKSGWVPAKRNFAVFFVTVYAFAAFAALAGVVRRRPRWAPGVMVGVAVLGLAAYFLLFPRGRLWVVVASCEVASADRPSEEWRVWFVGADTDLETEVEVAQLVKPVLQNPFTEPFSIRVLDRGCRIEDLHLKPGYSVCFAGMTVREPSLKLFPSLTAPLYQAGLRRAGGHRDLGDLETGASVPKVEDASGNAPPAPDLQAFERFLGEPCVYGWLDRRDTASTGVASPDLDLSPRLRPRLFIARIP